jgi:hypothetical protein
MHPRLGVQVHLDENSMAARLEKKTIERAAWLKQGKEAKMRACALTAIRNGAEH